MSALFYRLLRNIADCVRGRNLLWYLLAAVLTFILVISGFDWFYFVSFHGTVVYQFLFPAVVIGGLLPYLAPFALYLVGKLRDSFRTMNAACALGQAEFIGFMVAAFFKALTGRAHPPVFTSTLADTTRVFNFGFLHGGVFWGWPSSHTIVAFAGAVALLMLYPEKSVLRYLLLAYAFYVGLGVSMSIHWFSDFVAGAVMGTVIGVVVGKSFLERYRAAEA